MEFDDVLKNNKEVKRQKREKCKHSNLCEIRVIFKRCNDCGKLVPVGDDQYIEEHGQSGKGYDYTT